MMDRVPVYKVHVYDSNPFTNMESHSGELLVTFDFLVIVTNLPTMAKKLAIWLQRNHDGSEFFQVRDNVWLMAQLGYGSKMRYYLYRGVADLIAYSVLAKSNKKGCYYVNNKLLNL